LRFRHGAKKILFIQGAPEVVKCCRLFGKRGSTYPMPLLGHLEQGLRHFKDST
jgi:hypothetical protein